MVDPRFDDEAGVITRHAAVHVGVAVQPDAALLMPVRRGARAHDL